MTQMLCQRTVKSVIRASGVGLHSGKKVTLTMRPAAPAQGTATESVVLGIAMNDQSACLRRKAGMS